MLRADSDPKSTRVPPKKISVRSDRLRSGLPFESEAETVMSDCDAPSWVIASGVALTVIPVPYSDGPVSGGVGWFFIVQPAATASRTVVRAVALRERVRFICQS